MAEANITAIGKFNFFIPLAKIDEKKRTVSGYASTPSIDSDGEIVALKAVRQALPEYMSYGNIREMHKLSAVGTAVETNVDDKGLYLTAKIVDDSAWKKCVEGVYKGFSIGGSKLEKSGNIITKIEMTEISVVDRPANPDCKFQVAKSQKDKAETDGGYLLKAQNGDPNIRAATKLAKVANKLLKTTTMPTNPPAAKDGFSLPGNKPDKTTKVEGGEAVDKHPDGVISINDDRPNENITRKAETTEPYGDVTYADPGYQKDKKKRYPVDTEKHIKAAWGYIRQSRNAMRYDSSQLRAVKEKIVAAWKSKIDPAGPPKAEKKEVKKLIKALESGSLIKGFQNHNALALTLEKSETFDHKTDEDLVASLPSFLSLEAAPEIITDDNDLFSLEEFEDDNDLNKGMSSASTLSNAFDQLRSAQRSLMLEAKREGGDGKDKQLAVKLGSICKNLADLVGQKSEHEGREALDMSDADDNWVNEMLGKDFDMSNTSIDDPLGKALLEVLAKAMRPTPKSCMNKAKESMKDAMKARKEAKDCIKAVHGMCKASYMGKMNKAKTMPKDKDDEDGFDAEDAMEKLAKAYSSMQRMGNAMKAAEDHMMKAESMVGEQGEMAQDGNMFQEVPPGVKGNNNRDMAMTSPGGPGMGSFPPEIIDPYMAYPGKANHGGNLAKYARNGMVSVEVAELMAENQRLQGETEALRRIPANIGSRKPYSFDMTKFNNGGDSEFSRNGNKGEVLASLTKGIDPQALYSNDPDVRGQAAAEVTGRMLLTPSLAKSVVDPTFRGMAGIKVA